MVDPDTAPDTTPPVDPPAPTPPPAPPSIGRIVHVYSVNDDGTTESHAGVVTMVHGPTCINVCVFAPDGGTYNVATCEQGTNHRQWVWPPRT